MKTITTVFLVFSLLLILTGCSGQVETNNSENTPLILSQDIERVEIIHFHGTRQCYSCVTLGDYAEETVNTYFSEEVKKGKVSFAHINGELPENNEKVIKYGATGSSLFIGTYFSDGTFKSEQNINVWYKLGNKNDFMKYLNEIITKRLSGDMN